MCMCALAALRGPCACALSPRSKADSWSHHLAAQAVLHLSWSRRCSAWSACTSSRSFCCLVANSWRRDSSPTRPSGTASALAPSPCARLSRVFCTEARRIAGGSHSSSPLSDSSSPLYGTTFDIFPRLNAQMPMQHRTTIATTMMPMPAPAAEAVPTVGVGAARKTGAGKKVVEVVVDVIEVVEEVIVDVVEDELVTVDVVDVVELVVVEEVVMVLVLDVVVVVVVVVELAVVVVVVEVVVVVLVFVPVVVLVLEVVVVVVEVVMVLVLDVVVVVVVVVELAVVVASCSARGAYQLVPVMVPRVVVVDAVDVAVLEVAEVAHLPEITPPIRVPESPVTSTSVPSVNALLHTRRGMVLLSPKLPPRSRTKPCASSTCHACSSA